MKVDLCLFWHNIHSHTINVNQKSIRNLTHTCSRGYYILHTSGAQNGNNTQALPQVLQQQQDFPLFQKYLLRPGRTVYEYFISLYVNSQNCQRLLNGFHFLELERTCVKHHASEDVFICSLVDSPTSTGRTLSLFAEVESVCAV